MPANLAVGDDGDHVGEVRVGPDAVDQRIEVLAARLLLEMDPVVEHVDPHARRQRLIDARAVADVPLQVEVAESAPVFQLLIPPSGVSM